MVRLNADMTIDTTFDPGLGAATTSGSPIGTIVQQPDGRILIGGEFDVFQNTAVGRIARLNNNGTLDSSFNPGGQGLASGNIREIELLSDGRIIAVGNIVSYNGTGTDHFIRLSSTGALDTSFQPNVSAQIRSVEVQPDGKYLIVGDFRTVGAANLARPAAARINSDGTPDQSFDGGTATFRTPEDPNRLDAVAAAKLDQNGFLVIVGDFTHWNMEENVNYITRVATANVTVSPPPTITSQPVSQTICIGQSASFTVGATGDAPLTYQWSKNGVAISGATNPTYAIPSVTAGDAGSYTVVVSNNGGSVTSVVATLTPDNPPTITTQPQSTTVDSGAGFTLSVVATGTGPLTYQWAKNGVAIGGATASSFTVANAATGDAGNYTVTVSNACGPTTSGAATVTVNIPNQPPTIITQPQPSTLIVCAGTNVVYSVVATGTAPLAYQWNFNGVAIAGQTASTLTLANVTTANSGSYTVTVSNGLGSVTSTAVALTVATVPTITSQPVSTGAGAGGTISLSVVASSLLPVTYQWNLNGAAIPGATGSTYTKVGITTADAGTYTVTVSNACGSTTSNSASVTIGEPPTILGHPQSQQVKVNSASVLFNVVAIGTQPFSYQWLSNNIAIPGETNGVLQLTGITTAMAGNYGVIVANAFGSATSTNGVLTVLEPPVVTTQPLAQTVALGGTLNLSVVAAGTGPLGYQWSRNGVPITGAISSTLTIPGASLSDAGNYSVAVSNICGVVQSANVTVNVIGDPPTIVTPPASQVVKEGSNVVLSVVANGTAPLSYQWQINGADIPNATSSTFVLNPVVAANAGNYTVRVSNPLGTITSAIGSLTVQTLPSVTTQPQSQSINHGNTLSLSVIATGTAPFTYQWNLNGAPIAGATGSSYTKANATSADQGSYTVTISNICGSTTSATATVTVIGAPPTILGHPQSQDVKKGSTVTFNVVATGTAPLSYQWRFNGAAISGAIAQTFSIPSVDFPNAGSYSVTVSNPIGSATSTNAVMNVLAPASFTTQPQSQSITNGNSLTLSVAVGGTAPFTYQWLRNGISIAGATSNPFTIPVVTGNDAGTYTVVVSNVCGVVSSAPATVTILPAGVAPSIIGHPQPQQVKEGSSSVAFNVVATGTAPLTYQWLKNGLAIAGANSSTFAIAPVNTGDAGSYSVTVANTFGSATSTNALLTVLSPIQFTSQPLSQTIANGGQLSLSATVTGTTPITYQWNLNGSPIPGANGASYTVPSISAANAGNYTLTASNVCGAVNSAAATITLGTPPVIIFNPISEIVIEGTNAVISVDAIGTPELRYQWYYQPTFTGGNNGTPITAGTNATLVLRNVAFERTGWYYCIVANSFGSVTSQQASITVLDPPRITAQPGSQSVGSGSLVTLSSGATGTAALSYQWFFNGSPLIGANGPAFSLSGVQTSQAGLYFLQVSNCLGTVNSSTALLTVDGFTGGSSGSPQTIADPSVSGGQITFDFTTRDGSVATAGQIANLVVEGSTDLSTWTSVPASVSIVNDRFRVTFSDPGLFPARFYRIRYN
ncbi:MAG: beta strand repeat-containing protein [Limisphaerales bacterium]